MEYFFDLGLIQINLKISEMPFGQVPVLEVDGTMIPQSAAIGRFVARKFGECLAMVFDHYSNGLL